jgi:hypothetical protein
LKVKLKVCHFNTIELIKAALWAVLNTITEHNFQDAFKKWQKLWGWCIHAEWGFFEGDLASKPKVSFFARCVVPCSQIKLIDIAPIMDTK